MINQTVLDSTTILGDDITDHTAILQDYINNHGETVMGSGIYRFTNLTIPENHIFRGQGNNTTLKQIGSGVGFTLSNYNTLQNIRIQSANTGTTKAIYGENVKLVKLLNVTIDGLTIGVGQNYEECLVEFKTIAPDNTYGIAIENCLWQRGGLHGLKITGGCARFHVYGGRIQAMDGYGIYAAGVGAVELTLRDVIIEGNTLGSAYVDNWYASEVASCHFENSSAQTTPMLRCGINGACVNLKIHTNSFGGVLADYAIDFSGAGANVGIGIMNNSFNNFQIAAVYAAKLWNSYMIANTFNGQHLALTGSSQMKNFLYQDDNGMQLGSTGVQTEPTWNVGQIVV